MRSERAAFVALLILGDLFNLKYGSINIDSSDKNFWEVDSYELSLELYYDNAFDVRYSNCTEIIDYLTDETIGLLHETFGLKIAAEEPVMIISTADRCKIERGLPINLSTIDGNYSICLANLFVNGTCPNCNTHNATSNNCTSWKKMFDDFYQEHPGNQTTKIVLFTGNRLYDDHGILCNRSFIRNKTVITLQEIQQTRAVYKNKMLSCLLHEMSHAIGAPDHYHDVIENDDGIRVCANEALCVVCNEESGRPVWCSMGDDGTWRTDLLTCDIEDIYCTGCLNDIWEYLEEYQ